MSIRSRAQYAQVPFRRGSTIFAGMTKPLAALVGCLLGLAPAAAAHAQAAPIPMNREPGSPPYDPFAQGRSAQADPARPAEPSQPGFRITVPLCRRAEQAGDPLAKTDECTALLKAADDQAKACREAFETGDDKAVLSAACRQAAGFR
jgi:hypothetical protein